MNIRLLTARVAILGVVALTLFMQHKWAEDGIVDTALATLGFVLLLVGCIGRIWCAAYISGRKNRDLVTQGPFSLCRNPLYFFSFIALVGVGLAFESLTLTAAFAGVFFLTHWRTIILEERKLHELFGPAYAEYQARVPRFVPRLRQYTSTIELTMTTRTFTRAMLEAALIPLAFIAAEGIEFAHQIHVLPTLLWLY